MTEAEVARLFTLAGATLQLIGLVIAAQELENRGAGQGPIARVRRFIRNRLAPFLVLGHLPPRSTLRGQSNLPLFMSGSLHLRPRRVAPEGASDAERIRVLEAELSDLHSEVGSVVKALRRLPTETKTAIDDALAPVKQRLGDLDRRVSDLQVGGLSHAFFGLLLTALGVLVSLLGYLIGENVAPARQQAAALAAHDLVVDAGVARAEVDVVLGQLHPLLAGRSAAPVVEELPGQL